MSTSLLGSLAHADPEKAKARILHALDASQGDRKKAAELLDITHRSFYRIVERLRLWKEIDALMAENGYPVVPGPPRSPERIRAAVLKARGDLRRAATALEMRSVDALRERIDTLNLWDALDRALKAGGMPALKRTSSRAA
jgi:DNA-binding NtrC family response regulator